MGVAIGILLILLGLAMLWKRDRLARYAARLQQTRSRHMPWMYFGVLGRIYTSERAWRITFIPLLGLTSVLIGSLWVWQGVHKTSSTHQTHLSRSRVKGLVVRKLATRSRPTGAKRHPPLRGRHRLGPPSLPRGQQQQATNAASNRQATITPLTHPPMRSMPW